MFPDICLLPIGDTSRPKGPNVITQGNAMGTFSFRKQTASADRNQECEKWADVKVSRVLDVRAGKPTPREITCGLGSPHHERARAGWKPTPREIECGLEAHTTRDRVRAGSPHHVRSRAGWEGHAARDYVRAGEPRNERARAGWKPALREITCDTEEPIKKAPYSGAYEWAKRDSNPRHPLCKSGALTN